MREDYNNQAAVRWAIWCLENTDLRIDRILRGAKSRFGVPMARLERQLRDLVGDKFIFDRGRRLCKAHAPQSMQRRWKEDAHTKGKFKSAELAGIRHMRAMIGGD
jgi:hypothetical protein